MKLPFPVSIEPKTRFPMVNVPETNYALAWLPVTKIQIEYFLCETMDSQFDRSWYLERLKYSPRVPTEQLTVDNVRQAFIANLLFRARSFEESFLTQFRSAGTGERMRNLGFRLIMRNLE